MTDTAPLLEMRSISKTFPGVRALADVDFSVKPGEVHAIMGENGAGKSTLIKVLTGVYPPDSGEILLEGRHFSPSSPRDAQEKGISAIHQEVDLLPYLSVAENIFIGRQPMKAGRIDWREVNLHASEIMRRLGVEIDVTMPLGSYPVAIRQMVSIARAVDMSCRILVMDEPTSSLDESEVAQLFEVVRRLKAEGVGIIFITHFLDQLYEISDRVTVLRNGRQVGVFETKSLPKLDLVAHMLGKEIEDVEELLRQKPSQRETEAGTVFLSAHDLGRKGSVKPFDLEIRDGEVLGLAGLLGSGRTEVARLLFGIDKPTSGHISICGRRIGRLSPKTAIGHGIGFSPEDRRTEGIIPDLSVRENIVLAIQKRISRFGLVSRRKQEEIAGKYVEALNIATPSLDQPVRNLSGGNQQKVILARWLASQPRLLILDEPTRGIDVGAKAEVEALIESLSKDGVAILFISSELEEVVRRSHRIIVLRDRAKVAELDGATADVQTIMSIIAGEVES
jgi:simple sugar transport system ATP-binding protein